MYCAIYSSLSLSKNVLLINIQYLHCRGDEPIYGNMNYTWEGHTAGERWENYWKTETVKRGDSILNK